jgi:hypothetical protein
MPDGMWAPLAPSLEITQAFWDLFSPDDPVVRLRFLHRDRGNPSTEREGTLAELWPEVHEFQRRGYDVYYFVNRISRGAGTGKGGYATDQEAIGTHAYAADFDKGLPEVWHKEPSIIVRTSKVFDNGREIQKGQALWLTADCATEEFEDGQKRLAAHYQSDPSICNPSRVLRLPGSLHQKDPTRPQLVTFEDRTHGIGRVMAGGASGVLEGLPAAPVRRKSGANHTSKKAESRAGDEQTAHTGRSEVSYDTLRRWLMGIDPTVQREQWFKVIRAIAATPLEGNETPTNEECKRRLAHLFMEGALYRGRFVPPDGAVYRTPDEIDRAFDARGKEDGCTFGTIVHMAREAGWDQSMTRWISPYLAPRISRTRPGRKPQTRASTS